MPLIFDLPWKSSREGHVEEQEQKKERSTFWGYHSRIVCYFVGNHLVSRPFFCPVCNSKELQKNDPTQILAFGFLRRSCIFLKCRSRAGPRSSSFYYYYFFLWLPLHHLITRRSVFPAATHRCSIHDISGTSLLAGRNLCCPSFQPDWRAHSAASWSMLRTGSGIDIRGWKKHGEWPWACSWPFPVC